MYKIGEPLPEPTKEEILFRKISLHAELSIPELEDTCIKLLEIYETSNKELINAINELIENYKEATVSTKSYLVYNVLIHNPKLSESKKREIERKIHYLKLRKPESELSINNLRKEINHLANCIKNLRTINNLSTEKLSELSGVSGALINKIENCKILSIPKHSTLEKLATAFNINISELTQETEIKDKVTSKEDLKLLLINLGYKAKYINQIIDYADTMMIKQKIEEGKINV